jgi:hypothetical protein
MQDIKGAALSPPNGIIQHKRQAQASDFLHGLFARGLRVDIPAVPPAGTSGLGTQQEGRKGVPFWITYIVPIFATLWVKGQSA